MTRGSGSRMTPARVIALGFLALIACGTLLLSLPVSTASGCSPHWMDALFTATSATCVTGLVTVDTAAYWSDFGKTVILLLIQIGGLGVVTMTTMAAVLIGKRVTLRGRLLAQESLNQGGPSGIVRLVRYVFFLSISIEAVGAVLLAFRFVPDFGWKRGAAMSIFHAVSAFCNAGFDLLGDYRSLADYAVDPLVSLTVGALVIVGGLGFFVLTDLLHFRSVRKLTVHSRLVLLTTGILIAVPAILIFAVEYSNEATIGGFSPGGKLLASLFQSISPRTAGFGTIDLAAVYPATLFLTILLMFVGGSPGSTAGGIKTTTVAMHFLAVRSLFRGRSDVEFGKRRIDWETYNRALVVLIVSLIVVCASIGLLAVAEPDRPLGALIFEGVSAFGTVGLTLGLTPNLDIFAKLILILLMFFGRIGPLTIVIALRGKAGRPAYRYPEAKIVVG